MKSKTLLQKLGRRTETIVSTRASLGLQMEDREKKPFTKAGAAMDGWLRSTAAAFKAVEVSSEMVQLPKIVWVSPVRGKVPSADSAQQL